MAVRPLAAVGGAVFAGALGLGALSWAAGALTGDDNDRERCRRDKSGQEQPTGATQADPRP